MWSEEASKLPPWSPAPLPWTSQPPCCEDIRVAPTRGAEAPSHHPAPTHQLLRRHFGHEPPARLQPSEPPQTCDCKVTSDPKPEPPHVLSPAALGDAGGDWESPHGRRCRTPGASVKRGRAGGGDHRLASRRRSCQSTLRHLICPQSVPRSSTRVTRGFDGPGTWGCVCTATARGASRRLPQSHGEHGGRRLPEPTVRGTARSGRQRLSTGPGGQSHSALLCHTRPRLQRLNSRFSPPTAVRTRPSVPWSLLLLLPMYHPLWLPSWACAGAQDRCAE